MFFATELCKQTTEQAADKNLVDGLLLANKPVDWTSTKVVALVKKLTAGKKTGHGGTLDPAASGLLIIGVGEGVKSLRFLLEFDKTYLACVQLGSQTDTGDAQGKVIAEKKIVVPDRKTLSLLCKKFTGEQTQIPPMYSAIKVGGKRLYEYARAKKEVERKSRSFTVYKILPRDIRNDGFCIEIHCSKGAYIRTLAEDMGKELGTVGHLSYLKRLKVGSFSVEDAIDCEQLLNPAINAHELLQRRMLPVDSHLDAFPSILLNAYKRDRLRQGQEVYINRPVGRGWQRVYGPDNEFIGIAAACGPGAIRAKRIYNLCDDN